MSGIFLYVLCLAIYYVFLVILDLVGSVFKFRQEMLQVENPLSVKLKVDFNSDLAMASAIYILLYALGYFDA